MHMELCALMSVSIYCMLAELILFVVINKGDCNAETGRGSRICLNTQDITVTCIPPARVCDYIINCPDLSDELNCPCK